MRKAMVLTVGTGTRPDSNLVDPLLKSIRNKNPERIVLLATEESEPNAQSIQERCGLGGQSTLVRIEDADDVEGVFRHALSELRGLRDEGFQPEEVDADYTSGTKAMTAGLVLAAVAFGCGALNYVFGPREHGVVVAGRERFLSIPPAGIIAQGQIRLGLELLKRLQFVAVRRLFSIVQIPDAYDERLSAGLQSLAAAYDAWDKFQHGEFIKLYYEADLTLPELASFGLAEGIAQRVQAMHRRENDRRDPVVQDHLADLWNNARRRLDEGKYDDAVARLYRLTEMIAQFELAREYGVNTADVDPARLPISPEYGERLERQRRDGKVMIGLQEDYQLLQALNSPLGRDFQQRGKLSNLLGKRNLSILAHGQGAVVAADAEALAQELAALAAVVVPDFRERCNDLQFPWLAQVTP